MPKKLRIDLDHVDIARVIDSAERLLARLQRYEKLVKGTNFERTLSSTSLYEQIFRDAALLDDALSLVGFAVSPRSVKFDRIMMVEPRTFAGRERFQALRTLSEALVRLYRSEPERRPDGRGLTPNALYPKSMRPLPSMADHASLLEDAVESLRKPSQSPVPACKVGTAVHKKRGRKPSTDLKADKRIYDAWKSGRHESYEACGRALGNVKKREVANAIDRHRQRLKRRNASED